MNERPKITVLMTTLNSEKYIGEAVASILEQTFQDYECIIVDGGSTDGTIEYINSINDKRFSPVILEGKRRNAQLNHGINLSNTDVIIIMDSDDISLPDRIGALYNYLVRNLDIGVVGSWAKLISESGDELAILRRPVKHEAIIENLLAMKGLSFATCCFRKSVAQRIPFNEAIMSYAHDIEWLSRAALTTKFSNIPQPLIKLRQTNNSFSRKPDSQPDSILLQSLTTNANDLIEKSKSHKEKGTGYVWLGCIEYYYGSMHNARNFFLKAFYLRPFDALVIRYLLPSLLPQKFFKKLRGSKLFRTIAKIFRNLLQ